MDKFLRTLKEYLNLMEMFPDFPGFFVNARRWEAAKRLKRALEEPKLISRTPEKKPVCSYLPEMFSGEQNFVLREIENIKSDLTWEYGYEVLPENLVSKFGYCEILGPRGPVYGEKITAGLVLLGPSCYYPPHQHRGIEEMYFPLSGYFTLNKRGIYSFPDLLFVNDGEIHSLASGEKDPVLIAYIWLGEEEVLKNPDLKFVDT